VCRQRGPELGEDCGENVQPEQSHPHQQHQRLRPIPEHAADDNAGKKAREASDDLRLRDQSQSPTKSVTTKHARAAQPVFKMRDDSPSDQSPSPEEMTSTQEAKVQELRQLLTDLKGKTHGGGGGGGDGTVEGGGGLRVVYVGGVGSGGGGSRRSSCGSGGGMGSRRSSSGSLTSSRPSSRLGSRLGSRRSSWLNDEDEGEAEVSHCIVVSYLHVCKI
jgi:hypothetical protein